MNPNTILLYGDPIYGEAAATTTITPGMLVTTTGGRRTVGGEPTVTPAAAGVKSSTFARENEVVGYGIADNYLQDDNVLLMTNRPGDGVYAWLAAGQNIAAGAALASVGGGLLGAVTTGAAQVARAAQTINNSAGGAVPVRIKVEVL